MKKINSLIRPLVLSLALLLAACAPQGTSEPTAASTEAPAEVQASTPSPQPTPEPTGTPAPQSIAEIAIEDGRFETLVAALQATDLFSALQDGGPYTVFAPTDDAFAALPEGTVESLLDDPEALSDILLYHVAEGQVIAEDVVTMDGQEVETLSGASITISVQGETVRVNDAQVIITDIEAANGVIHVIDSVLLPPH